VDIGGGVGKAVQKILEKYTELDAKNVVLQGSNIMEMVEYEKIALERVRLMKHDFWSE
jgi:cobalamin biosynthesis Co2+ chelatase CbiK